jgi:predicted  nucleic acid-binding Zn-ribbon protein
VLQEKQMQDASLAAVEAERNAARRDLLELQAALEALQLQNQKLQEDTPTV